MQAFVLSGGVTDLVIAILLSEGLLLLYLWRNEQASARVGMIGNLIAGGSLVLALRMALQDAGWIAISVCLLLALVGHLMDLSWRLRVLRRGM